MNHPLQQTFTEVIAPHRHILKRTFFLFLFCLALMIGYVGAEDRAMLVLGSLGIVVIALLPSFLWISGKTPGMPIAPLIGVGEIVIVVIPILSRNRGLAHYSEEAILGALLLEMLFLVTFVGTWYYLVRRPLRLPPRVYSFQFDRIDPASLHRVWLTAMVSMAIYSVLTHTGMIYQFLAGLPPAAHSVLRAFMLAAGMVAAFFMSLAIGMRSANGFTRGIFYAALLMHLMASGTALLLSSFVAILMACITGFAMGRGRLPWVSLVAIVAVLSVLHSGKAEMRVRYWGFADTAEFVAVQPSQYPDFYRQWFIYGLRLDGPSGYTDTSEDEGGDLLDRASLIQMVLYAQARAPEHIELLNGKTLFIIPKLLVPRFLWPGKPRTHEGQVMLNVHFGRQTLDETERTYITWGMLAEFYANFGTKGAAIFGVLLGWLVAFTTRLSLGVPMGSLRCAVSSIFLITSAVATQMAVSTWITSTAQALFAVAVMCTFIMRPVPVQDGPTQEKPA